MQHETKVYELDSGARLLVVNIPNTISFYWASHIRGGFNYAPTAIYEMPHLLEHLAFEGTKSYPDSYKFKAEVEKNGAYYNAFTGRDFVWYEFAGNPEEMGRIVDINFSQMFEPLLDSERIEQQQKVIRQEWSRNKENDAHRSNYYNWLAIKPTAYPDIDERMATVQRVTSEDLKEFHAEHYVAANIDFVVAGDLNRASVKSLISQLNRHLSKIPKGQQHAFKEIPFGDFGDKVVTKEPYKKLQSRFILDFLKTERSSQPEGAAIRVLSTILGTGMGSRLFQKARERGLTYAINSGMWRGEDHTALLIVGETEVQNLRPLIELSASELADISSDGFSDEELDRAKGFIVGSIRRGYQTPAQYAGWYDNDFLRGREMVSLEDWIADIEKVDRSAISNAAKKYAKAENMLLTMVGQDLEEKKGEYKKMLSDYFS